LIALGIIEQEIHHLYSVKRTIYPKLLAGTHLLFSFAIATLKSNPKKWTFRSPISSNVARIESRNIV
jgi:hypothetical protein